MAMGEQEPDLSMNAEDLYLEETFTDRRVGTITRMTPVDGDGKPDAAREVVYLGQTQMMTPAGALPLSFEIEASSLQQAAQQFGDEASKAAEDTINRLKEMEREQASSIVTPESMGGMGGGMPGGGGGFQLK